MHLQIAALVTQLAWQACSGARTVLIFVFFLPCYDHERVEHLTDMRATFDVDRWLQQKRPAELHVSQPYQTGCWSKLSARQGGGVQHGDNSGALIWSLYTWNGVCWRTSLACPNVT